MCFNSRVSLITFIIGLFGSINLFNLGYKPESFFYAWVVLMQLVEFFLWRNQPCNDANRKISNIGMFINHTEPIILWLAILFFYSNRLPTWVNLYMLFFIVFTIFYTKIALKKLDCTTVTPESSPHLHWKWNQANYARSYYGIFLLALILLSIYGLDKGFNNAVLVTVSFVISYMIYGQRHAVGAMWCFMAALAPWFIPLINKYF